MDHPAADGSEQRVAETNFWVVHERFCYPEPVELSITGDDFSVTRRDNGEVLLRVRQVGFGFFRDKRVLCDASGSPVVTFREKLMTMHRRWNAYRGNSTEPGDLLFTLKRTPVLDFRTRLAVFLPETRKKEVCDYEVVQSFFTRFARSCVVYRGRSQEVLAKMETRRTLRNVILGPKEFTVIINPRVDYAFIVSLIVILDAIDMAMRSAALDVATSF